MDRQRIDQIADPLFPTASRRRVLRVLGSAQADGGGLLSAPIVPLSKRPTNAQLTPAP
jgi:hypothetical protein